MSPALGEQFDNRMNFRMSNITHQLPSVCICACVLKVYASTMFIFNHTCISNQIHEVPIVKECIA